MGTRQTTSTKPSRIATRRFDSTLKTQALFAAGHSVGLSKGNSTRPSPTVIARFGSIHKTRRRTNFVGLRGWLKANTTWPPPISPMRFDSIPKMQMRIATTAGIGFSNRITTKPLPISTRQFDSNPKDACKYVNHSAIWELKGKYDQMLSDSNEPFGSIRPHRCLCRSRSRVAGKGGTGQGDHGTHRGPSTLTQHKCLPGPRQGLEVERQSRQALSDYAQASSYYDEDIQRCPTDATPFTGRAEAYLGKAECDKAVWATADYDQAISDYTEAIRLYPKSSFSYTGRGRARAELARYRGPSRTTTRLSSSIRLCLTLESESLAVRHLLRREISEWKKRFMTPRTRVN